MTNWPFVIQLYTSFRVSTSEVKQELRAAMRASILGSNICHMCFAKGTVIPQPFASQATTYNTPTIKDSVKWLAEQTFRHIICTACLMNKLGLTLKNCTVASCHAHTHTGSSHYASAPMTLLILTSVNHVVFIFAYVSVYSCTNATETFCYSSLENFGPFLYFTHISATIWTATWQI